MPKFIVEQYETHVREHEVEADTFAEAIKKVFDGDTDESDLTYSVCPEDLGMLVEQLEDITEEDFEKIRLEYDEVIPSIRSIKIVE